MDFDINKYNPNTIKTDLIKLVNYIKKQSQDKTIKSFYLKKYFSCKGDMFLDIDITKKIKVYNINLVTNTRTYDLTNDFFVNFLIKNNINLVLNLLYNSKRIINILDGKDL